MKALFIFLTSILISTPLLSQSMDSAAIKKDEANNAKKESVNEGSKKQADQFIDEDGDGICDKRASGLGFKHGNTYEKRKGTTGTGQLQKLKSGSSEGGNQSGQDKQRQRGKK